MTSTQILGVIAVLAVAAIIAGVAMQWGPALALIVGGALVFVSVAALLFDPDGKP